MHWFDFSGYCFWSERLVRSGKEGRGVGCKWLIKQTKMLKFKTKLNYHHTLQIFTPWKLRDWDLWGPCRENLHFHLKRAIRIAGNPVIITGYIIIMGFPCIYTNMYVVQLPDLSLGLAYIAVKSCDGKKIKLAIIFGWSQQI